MSEAEQPDQGGVRLPAPAQAAAAERQLASKVEEASINAWPASSQLILDGWLVRFAQGFTKRANSVIPIYPGQRELADKVRFCENLYAREQLKTIFRITSIDKHDGLDAFLAARGYLRQDPTEVLHADLADPAGEELDRPPPSFRPLTPGPTPLLSHRTSLQPLPLPKWLDIYARLTGLSAQARPLHGAILRSIPLPCCHAVLGEPEDPFACGLAVLEQDLVGLFDVVTRADARRNGHGEALVAGLLDWGRRRGARTAYLQMAADNTPAAGLYRKLGFRPLYRYWYRVSG